MLIPNKRRLNTVKKIIAGILALILIPAMLFGACAEAADVTGAWYADMNGMVMILTLNENGVYTLEKADEAMIGTWVLEGDILYVDKGTLGEDKLHYDAAAHTLDRNGMLFAREAIAAFEPGEPITAEPEDFTGSWTSTNVDTFGAVLPGETAELRMDAVIDGAKVILTIESAETETLEGEAVFADSALILTISRDQERVFSISMLDSGMIRISTELAAVPATFYLEKNEAAA